MAKLVREFVDDHGRKTVANMLFNYDEKVLYLTEMWERLYPERPVEREVMCELIEACFEDEDVRRTEES